ncbi:fumarylacetoacetate hydrolase family protein [Microlunatus soli]|uniref:2-keto-4-pentenoate hydratase/2-oxohepta-3-ene-1,7-dioic acid hydratase (Catechol pathway) n=1 Tax=Microlunatus soli TaxID=630515 RepID=A0A1H1ZEJ7_9ACTN|nr:fumarylacetoacetate hydrolase family protein [Microlunatus soli]SDT32090.1 2-keto-4-pentenoate hydratase/2-oxohepta-3-ene-1,7-dioic acid hydratase (catechol pathway) [Microlunatus soli]
MRIARFSAGSDPQYGIVELAVDGGEHADTVSAVTGDPLATKVQLTGQRFDLSDVRLLAPVIPRSKVVAVGRNYAEHAAELGNEVPETPMTFLKPNTSVIGPDEAIVYPTYTNQLSYEGELAIVIGRICKEVPAERVPEVIFGYTIANDVTARDLQGPDKQWARAKGSDTFCPLGPWIVTHLGIDEAENLMITTTVDDEVRQHGPTRDMLNKIVDLVVYITSYTTLLPGDVILTGTPAGVGPMNPGQQVSIEIDGIGKLSNPVVAAQ